MKRGWVRRICFLAVISLGVSLAGEVFLGPQSAMAACPASVANEVSAKRTAKACGHRIEVLSDRGEYRQVFANANGSLTLEDSVVPSRVHRADGSWADVDPTLVASGGAWAPRASTVDVVLSNGGSGPFATYRNGGATMTLSWPLGALPAPTVSGSSLRYASVLPGVNLWVTVSATSFRPVLEVVNAAAAANPALDSVGYTIGGTARARVLPDGRVRFADATGAAVAMTDPAVMWDSTVDRSIASAGPAEVSTAEHAGDFAHVGQVAVGIDGAELTVRPDKSMLAAAATVFPLFIDPSISPSQNRFEYADSSNVNNSTDYARVGKDPDSGDLYRSYFNFPTSQGGLTWLGKKILSAEFDIWLWHSYACSDSQDDWTWAYQVTGLATSSTRIPWSGSGSRALPGNAGVSAQSHANKDGGCGAAQPDFLTTFSGAALKTRVQAAADGNWSMFSFGLCACNPSSQYESGQFRWKKFYIDSRAKLIVTYDTVPGVPAKLTSAGAACGSRIGTTSPTLSAQAVDADTNDTLSAVFSWQQLPSGAVQKVTRTGIPFNNFTTVPLSLGSTADGHTYQWQVQTTDAAGYSSPPSAWCTFTVDIAGPPVPTVTATGSPSYLACDPANIAGCASPGGPGVGGTFVLGPNGATNVTSFTYGWSNPPTTTVAVTAGTSATVKVTPPEYGLNTLYVSSSNGVKSSPVVPYRFLVDAPSAPLGYWPLDDINGHSFNDLAHGNTLSNSGAVSWVPDARYIGASAANFTGSATDSAATATVPGLDTSKSFSVAAWVRLTDASAINRTAVAQDDTSASGFYLGSRLAGSSATPRWTFTMPDSAPATGGWSGVSTGTLSTDEVGKWVHLLGVFDAGQKTVSLYVNGNLVGTAPRTAAPWKAGGVLTVGRGLWSGSPSSGWLGQIADVRVWDRVVTADDLWGTDADPVNGVPATTGLLSPMEVGRWDFSNMEGCGCNGPSPDDAYFGRPLFLGPGWENATPTSAFVSDSHNLSAGSLWTDGVSGYASTTDATDPNNPIVHPVLRTDQSFTVSAWVNLSATPTHNATAVAQTGVTDSPFFLQYNYTDTSAPEWKFMVVGADVMNPLGYAATISGASTGVWTHLVGVYDAHAGIVKLYVNGALVSTRTGASSFQANGSLTVGTARWDAHPTDPFPGEIDQVEVWQGVKSDREIAGLL